MANVNDESKQRVAFDLMEKISNREAKGGIEEPDSEKARRYYLTLYRQCLRIVNGDMINVVLGKEEEDSKPK